MAKVIKKEKEVILKEVISLEDYKKQVYDCLLKLNRTIPVAERLMKEYEEDFKGFLEENLPPNAAATGMAMNLL